MRYLTTKEIWSLFTGDKTNDPVIQAIASYPCVVGDGHFELASKQHSSVYFQKDLLLCQDENFRLICRRMYESLRAQPEFESVTGLVGPERWGARLAIGIGEYARAEGQPLTVLTVGRPNGTFELTPDQVHAVQGGLFVLVDDVWTAGTTLDQIWKLVKQHGGRTAMASVILSRSNCDFDHLPGIPVPLHRLVRGNLPLWKSSADCPLCRAGFPIDPSPRTTARVDQPT